MPLELSKPAWINADSEGPLARTASPRCEYIVDQGVWPDEGETYREGFRRLRRCAHKADWFAVEQLRAQHIVHLRCHAHGHPRDVVIVRALSISELPAWEAAERVRLQLEAK